MRKEDLVIMSTVAVSLLAYGCLTTEEWAEGVGATGEAVKDGAVHVLNNPDVGGIITSAALTGLAIWKAWSSVLKRKKYRELEERNAKSDELKASLDERIAWLESQVSEKG